MTEIEEIGSDFTGRVAIVTGASSGIGLAIASQLVELGAHVCVTGRHSESVRSAVDRLGSQAMGSVGNVSDCDHRHFTIQQVMEEFGRIDCLVNNVGINPRFGALMEQPDLAAFRKTLHTNVVAPLEWTQAAWHAHFRHHGGVVLNMASVGAFRSTAGLGAYNVSKAALVQLTRQLAVELAPTVRVNALAPAVVKTRFSRELYEDRETEVASSYPMGRLGTGTDVAAAAIFLLGAGSSWITGQTHVIDGGLLLTAAGG